MSAVRHLQQPLMEGYVWQPEKQQQKKRPVPTSRPGRTMMAVTLCAAFVATLALGYVAQKVTVMKLSYALTSAQADLAALERKNGFLQLEVVAARSPERVERIARERLSMSEPKNVEYLVLAPPTVQLPEETTPASTNPGVLRVLSAWVQEHWPIGGAAEASLRR